MGFPVKNSGAGEGAFTSTHYGLANYFPGPVYRKGVTSVTTGCIPFVFALLCFLPCCYSKVKKVSCLRHGHTKF